MGRICFIVGHGKGKSGGYDPGATNGDFHEFKIAKEIARYAQEYYNKYYSEVADLMNYDGSIYLNDRIKKLKTDKYDFIAEIHLNAGGGVGTECYYHHESTRGKLYAEAITNNIAAALGTTDRGAKIKLNKNGADYFGIIRSTKPCAVLIETVFIDNAFDLTRIKTAEGQRKCGEAIAKAVASCRGLIATKPATSTAKPATNNTVKTPEKASDGSFKVKVICSALNIRKGAGTLYKKVGCITDNGTYTIVETNKAGTWGKLKSGAGWISIKSAYVKKL